MTILEGILFVVFGFMIFVALTQISYHLSLISDTLVAILRLRGKGL